MILEFRDRKKSNLLSFLENNNNFLFKNMSRRPGAVFRTRIFKIYTKNSILGDQKLDSMQNFMFFWSIPPKFNFGGIGMPPRRAGTVAQRRTLECMVRQVRSVVP